MIKSGKVMSWDKRPWRALPQGVRRDPQNPHRTPERFLGVEALAVAPHELVDVLYICTELGWCGEDALAFLRKPRQWDRSWVLIAVQEGARLLDEGPLAS